MYFSFKYYLLTFVEAKDLSSVPSSSGASYTMAMSPAIVTLLFLALFGFIMIETDFRSMHLRLEKFSFSYSSRSSLELLFSLCYSDSEEEFACLHLSFIF